jgi:hypothetical protein
MARFPTATIALTTSVSMSPPKLALAALTSADVPSAAFEKSADSLGTKRRTRSAEASVTPIFAAMTYIARRTVTDSALRGQRPMRRVLRPQSTDAG